MGVIAAIPASVVEGMDRSALTASVKDTAEQMIPRLATYVGQARPQGPMAVRFDGPQDDDLQGRIYAVTLAAPFEERDLPSDCDAYRALYGATAPPEAIGYVETTGDGNAP